MHGLKREMNRIYWHEQSNSLLSGGGSLVFVRHACDKSLQDNYFIDPMSRSDWCGIEREGH